MFIWRIPEEPTPEELSDSLAAIQSWIRDLDHPYGWINDSSRLRIQVVASLRKQLAEHLKIVEPQSSRWCAGMATIALSPLIRGVGTAVGWLTPYAFATHYCESEATAIEWVAQRLAERRRSLAT